MGAIRPYSPGAGSGPWRRNSIGSRPGRAAAVLCAMASFLVILQVGPAAHSAPQRLSFPLVLTQVPAGGEMACELL